LSNLNRAAEERQQRTTQKVQAYNTFVDQRQEFVEVALDPMVSREIDEARFLLVRAVRIDGQRYQQGLVIDSARLLDWLQVSVLDQGDLSARARIHSDRLGQSQSAESSPFQYRHRFAEPFDQVAGILSLEPLSDWSGSTYIYTLSAFVVMTTMVGLLALYRTVTVVVSYAEQRQNFVSSVTHELKTPLTAIRMYGEMLRDGLAASEDKRDRYYRVITAESERLTRLVNNVLELAHLEKKDRPLTWVTGDVGPVLEEAVDILRPHAREKGFTIETEIESGLPAVRFDRDALVQVIFNLVDNALKYSSAAENKEIIVAAFRQNMNVSLVVSDHGPGVASRHLPRVFEPFYRGENELTRTSKGTGIGLALVRGMVERMGGTVRGENARTGGFVVSILLPIVSG
jgi:signal transduction histidine kinase